MRKWTFLGLALGFAAMVAMAADEGPEYQGRSLLAWSKQIDPHGVVVTEINGVPVPEPPEYVAIKAIGTNALPTLLKWIATKESDEPKDEPRPLAPCFYPSDAERAELVFGILGQEARPAIPQLTTLALKFSDRERYDRCIDVLVGLAPDSALPLKKILDQGPDEKRFTVVEAFALFDTNTAMLLLPGTIRCLVGRAENLGWRAAQSLSESALPSSVLLPALTNALPSASTAGRGRVFRCLYWSRYPALEAVPVLRTALKDSNAQIRQEATWALQRIAPEALTNAPAR